jgi:YetA-like protein
MSSRVTSTLICSFMVLTGSFFSGTIQAQTKPAQAQPVPLGWLDKTPPPMTAPVSWGVPWSRGTVKKDQAFTLKTADGTALPLQTWPMAYWPDGTLKWSGFATYAGPNATGGLTLTPSRAVSVAGAALHVTRTAGAVDIDTGALQCRIPASGEFLIDTLTIGGKVVARQGRLEGIVQSSPEDDAAQPPVRHNFVSDITSVTVEQSGPIRAVVKISGMHKYQDGSRRWLPFYVRFYFYAGQTSVKMVHSFVFDGDEAHDFIRGLAVVFTVPMREEIQNRHVRFGSEGTGLWAEPVEPMIGYNRRITNADGSNPYPAQENGQRVPNKSEFNPQMQNTLSMWASWDDFRLIQPNAQGFTVEKRTSSNSSWLAAGSGKRSSGLVFVGDVSGGLGVVMKDFWQKYPTSLEVRHAKSDAAELRIWIWSPDAPAMDLRHYDTVAHGLNESYEDVQPGLSTANGVARTTDLMLFPSDSVPAKADTGKEIAIAQQPPVLVATPQYLHDAGAFGIWSLKDTSTPFKKNVEDHLDAELSFYQSAIDQYNWYGFWDYGDIMHSYDAVRHAWRYDIGGFAWDNDEQGTEMWLWYSFLRSGRPDLYRMAEAMTRQVSEVDCYHQGKLAGLGSRHNVNHWGDGAKEARISQAAYRRFYYYLSTDERIGDVMREMLVSEQRVAEYDPMREALPATPEDAKYPARIRGGPDWLALAGNWMTEWERTGDTKWRDKIYAGIDSIKAMPYWFKTSQSLVWRFFPDTDKLQPRDNNPGGYNLVTNMGGPEVMAEMNEFIGRPDWVKIWTQYCRLTNTLDADLLKRDQTTGTEGADAQYGGGGRLSGYAYYETKDPAYAKKAIGVLNFRGNPNAAPTGAGRPGAAGRGGPGEGRGGTRFGIGEGPAPAAPGTTAPVGNPSPSGGVQTTAPAGNPGAPSAGRRPERAAGGLEAGIVRRGPEFEKLQHLDGPDVLRPLDLPIGFDGIITNEVIQNSLQMIEVLEFAKDQLPQQ